MEVIDEDLDITSQYPQQTPFSENLDQSSNDKDIPQQDEGDVEIVFSDWQQTLLSDYFDDATLRENINLYLSEKDRELLGRENEIRSIPKWQIKCKNITLNHLKSLHLLIAPNEELLQMCVRDCGHLTSRQAGVLFLKLNGCLEGNQEAFVEEDSLLIDETTVDIGKIPHLTLGEFRSLGCGKINVLLPQLFPRFLSLLSPTQLRELDTKQISAPQFNELFEEPFDEGVGEKQRYLLSIFSGPQIRDMQHRLSGSILRNLNEEKTKTLDVSVLTQNQVDEWINNHPAPATMLNKLDPHQIPEIQDKLLGSTLQHLPLDQTHSLNVSTLTQPQVDEWINDYSAGSAMLSKLEPDQIPGIQDKLTGASLRHLSVEHTRALDVSTLTQAQVDEWINDNSTRAVMLNKLKPDQIPDIQDKLPGSTLQHLSEEYTHILHVSALTQAQVNEWINDYRAPSAMLNKLQPDQIPDIQNKLTFTSLTALSHDHTHKINVNSNGFSDLKLREMFENNKLSQISPKLSELQYDTLISRLGRLGITAL
jgi:hypothetical protein